MSTEAIQRTRNTASSDNRDERARRAVKAFRQMQYGLTAYARAITRNKKVRIEIAAGPPRTTGEIIYYCPPIELGDMTPHERKLCSKRNQDGLQVCPACRVREQVLVNIYHEISHIVEGTFATVTERAKTDALHSAIKEWGGKYESQLRAKFATVGVRTNSYLGLAALINPFLPGLTNALEDARIDNRMFENRKGTKKMMIADTFSILRNGFPMPEEDATIEAKQVVLNAQVTVGCYLEAAGYQGWQEYLHPRIGETLSDAKLQQLLSQVRHTLSVADVYNLAFPILARLREFGFLLLPEEEEEQKQPEQPQDQQEEQEEQEQDQGESQDEGSSAGSDQHDPENEGSSEKSEGSSEGEGDSDDEAESSNSPGEGETGESEDDSSDSDLLGVSETGDGDSQRDPEGSSGDSEDQTTDSSETSDLEEDEDGSSSGSGGDSLQSEPGSGEDERPDRGDDSGGVHQDDPSEESGGGDAAEREAASDSGNDEGYSEESSKESEESGSSDEKDSSEYAEDEQTGSSNDSSGQSSDGSSDSSSQEDSSDGTSSGDSTCSGDERSEGLAGYPEASADGTENQDEQFGTDQSGDFHSREDDLCEDSSSPEEEEGGLESDRESEDDLIDSGADEGHGGIESSAPPMGDERDVAAVMAHAHRPDNPHEEGDLQWNDDMTPEEKESFAQDLAAIAVAVIQGQYFETASAEVGMVEEFRYPDGPAWTEGKWGNLKKVANGPSGPRSREAQDDLTKLGIICDVDIPESILGPALLKTRKIFSDNKRAAYEPNKRSGRVNARVLGRRAWNDDDRLFGKKLLPKKKDYAVVIGIDISSSNLGSNLALVKRAAFGQADLLARAGISFSMVAHSTNAFLSADGFTMKLHHVKDWDEPWDTSIKSRVAELIGNGGNLDGHALEYMRNQINKMQVTDKIILYYTDGKMPAANHDEELEVLQRQIKLCKRDQITLLGVGIRTDSPTRHGLDTVQVNSDDDLPAVIEHLGKRLEQRAR